MIDFIFGAIAAFFGGLLPMQLLVGKVYALDEWVERKQDPDRYWTLTLVHATVLAGTLLVLII